MAFVTGMILMYIPEEPAFRLLTRLMDERGANLRQLYLPGLEGLKNYLRMFEWLMDRIHPELREHLEVCNFLNQLLYSSSHRSTAHCVYRLLGFCALPRKPAGLFKKSQISKCMTARKLCGFYVQRP